MTRGLAVRILGAPRECVLLAAQAPLSLPADITRLVPLAASKPRPEGVMEDVPCPAEKIQHPCGLGRHDNGISFFGALRRRAQSPGTAVLIYGVRG
jgi:hypothetical protein